ncbi:MAG: isoprenylcysteine carboxylmethyltransferase family protein [Oligoflexales bacterium]
MENIRFFARTIVRKPLCLFALGLTPLVFYEADPTSDSFLLGASLSAVGILLRLITAGFQKDPFRFEITGPYRFVRHPFHFATFLIMMGVCIAARGQWSAIYVLVGVLTLYRHCCRSEDDSHERLWGPRYREYKTYISAFIPNILPVAGSAPEKFSVHRFLTTKYRPELDIAAFIIVGYGALYLIKDGTLDRGLNWICSALMVLLLLGRLYVMVLNRRMILK